MRRAERTAVEVVPLTGPRLSEPHEGPSVLIVDPALDTALLVTAALSGAGLRVTVAETFAQAKPLLASQPPAILVTALRLGAYNGLHLVLRGKSLHPEMAAVVTSTLDDHVLQNDAEALGATFVVMPRQKDEMLAAVLRTLFRPVRGEPIRPPYERRVRERRTATLPFPQDRRGHDRRSPLGWVTPSL